MGAIQPWHWIVLALVVVALFGYNKLPDVTRSVGRSLRIFKTEMKGLSEDDKVRDASTATVAPPVAPVVVDPAAVGIAAPVVAPVAPVLADPTAEQIAQAQAVLAAAARAQAGIPTAAPDLAKHVPDPANSSAH